MKRQNDRSQEQRGANRGSGSARTPPPGTPGDDAAAQSEHRLDQEERSLVGDTARDHNLTGSTTWVTLPDQERDQPRDQSRGTRARGQPSRDRDTPR